MNQYSHVIDFAGFLFTGFIVLVTANKEHSLPVYINEPRLLWELLNFSQRLLVYELAATGVLPC